MEDLQNPTDSIPKIDDLPKEAKEKLEAMKGKLEKFKKEVLKESKDIVGVALMPPEEKEKEKINVLVLTAFNEKDIFEKREKLIKDSIKAAEAVDKNIKPLVMDILEVRESCFDGKYEILRMIASSAPLYDPNDLIAALRISEVHKTMVIKKFEKYVVSYIAVGSLFRGDAKSHDIDVYLVIDDTDVKRMPRFELKDKLSAIIRTMGFEAAKITGVKKQFHIQTYILTDFWESVKDANPVIFTFLRDGVPLYDRGVFMPWKLLLNMGRIRPSQEAIEMQMDVGEKLIQRTKMKMLSILGEDLYYAILNPAQAALMLYGIAPPTPKETIQLLDEIYVKKEKLLEKKYVDILEKIRKYYKDIEHGKIKEVSGKDVDDLLKDSEDYLNRIKKLFEQIEKRRRKETFDDIYKNAFNLAKETLEINKCKIGANLSSCLKKELVDTKKLSVKVYNNLKDLEKAKKDFAKLSSQEIEKLKRETRDSIREMFEYVQRKMALELERAKIKFKYGEKYGEALLLDTDAFIIPDISAKDKEVQKAKLLKDGSLREIRKSSIEDMQKHLEKIKIPEKVFIKEKTFEDLRKLFGKDIEILINY